MIKVASYVSRVTGRIGIHKRQSLTQGAEYEVVEISNDYYRIIDESLDPILYHRSYFIQEFLKPPPEWDIRTYDEGDYNACMPIFAARRFFEDFHDGVAAAQKIFFDYVHSPERKAAWDACHADYGDCVDEDDVEP